MKKLLFLPLFLFSFFAMKSQTVLNSSITFNDAGGGYYYLIDSTIYDSGRITVTRTSNMDSLTLDTYLVADTVSSYSTYITELASYNRYISRIATLESSKQVDSLQQAYYSERLTQLSVMIDSVRAQ